MFLGVEKQHVEPMLCVKIRIDTWKWLVFGKHIARVGSVVRCSLDNVRLLLPDATEQTVLIYSRERDQHSLANSG